MQTIQDKRLVMFDIEVYPNWWCIVFKPLNDDYIVVTSDDKSIINLYDIYLHSILFGFNIKNYDMKILNAISSNVSTDRIYQLSKNIINKVEDELDNISFWNKYLFSDLRDDWKGGSLKEFESNKGIDIEETEIDFNKSLVNQKEKDLIIKYCKHDVLATELLFKEREDYINAKLQLAELYNISKFKALKSTNAKLAALILKAKKIDWEPNVNYIIPEKVKDYILDNIPSEILNLFKILSKESKEVKLFDNDITFGIGGIHSVYCENLFTESDNDNQLVNVDVTSYYPNLIIHFNYMSRNVLNSELYSEIYELRKKYKSDAKTELKSNGKSDKYWKLMFIQLGLKLILNTVYGAMKNEYNDLYDPYQAGSLCYTGQLLLAALANKLFKNIKNLKVIQTNTDGILVKCPKNKLKDLENYVSEWETLTGLNMEFDYIKSFYQRDVNNYIECTGNEKDPYKLKGKWSNQAIISGETISNLNAPITHKALLYYYVSNIPIEKTILECNNLMDFCFTTKTGHTYDETWYEYYDKMISANKVNRVIASTNTNLGTIYKYKEYDDEDYPKETDPSYKTFMKRKLAFESKYWKKFGRLDKAAEIPEHCELVNSDISKPIKCSLDKKWYINYCQNKIKELINV